MLQLRGSGPGLHRGTKSSVDDVSLGLVDDAKGLQLVVGGDYKRVLHPTEESPMFCMIG